MILALGPIWQYGEIIAATVIVIGVIVTISKMWTTFSVRLESVITDIGDMKETEKTNHESNRKQIEEMRKERHMEIMELENKLALQINKNNDVNTSEHKQIMEGQQNMLMKITEIVTELRLAKEPVRSRIKKEA